MNDSWPSHPHVHRLAFSFTCIYFYEPSYSTIKHVYIPSRYIFLSIYLPLTILQLDMNFTWVHQPQLFAGTHDADHPHTDERNAGGVSGVQNW